MTAVSDAMKDALSLTQKGEGARPSDAAKVMRRKAYEAVEEAYDDRLKCYAATLNGRPTDQVIADRVGCSVALIQSVREEFFGPAELSEPTEEIKALQVSMAHLEREAQDFEQLASGLRKKAVDIKAELRDLKAKLEQLCKDHGWYH